MTSFCLILEEIIPVFPYSCRCSLKSSECMEKKSAEKFLASLNQLVTCHDKRHGFVMHNHVSLTPWVLSILGQTGYIVSSIHWYRPWCTRVRQHSRGWWQAIINRDLKKPIKRGGTLQAITFKFHIHLANLPRECIFSIHSLIQLKERLAQETQVTA